MLPQRRLQIRILLSLSLHNPLDHLLVLLDRNPHHIFRVVERDSACLHPDRLLQVSSPRVVDSTASLLAACDRVGLCELGTLLDDLVRNLSIVAYFSGHAQVDVSRREILNVEPDVAVRPRVLYQVFILVFIPSHVDDHVWVGEADEEEYHLMLVAVLICGFLGEIF